MGLIPQNTRNLLNIHAILEPSSCTFIRSLIDKYQQPEYQPARRHSTRASNWSHMTLLRLPAIDPSVYRLAVSKASRLYAPFEVAFARPYHTITGKDDYVALEYWSYELSEVLQMLRKELLGPVEEHADTVTAHLRERRGRSRRQKIMRGLEDDSPHVTIASKLTEEESGKILSDLRKSFGEHGNVSKYTVRAIGLELVELNTPGNQPRYLETEKFPFQDTASSNLETSLEVPNGKGEVSLSRSLGSDGSPV